MTTQPGKPRSVRPSPELQAFYADAVAALKAVTDRHPAVRNIEVIALFGQAAGAAIGMCHADERDLARATLIENADRRAEEVGAAADAGAGGPRQGRTH